MKTFSKFIVISCLIWAFLLILNSLGAQISGETIVFAPLILSIGIIGGFLAGLFIFTAIIFLLAILYKSI